MVSNYLLWLHGLEKHNHVFKLCLSPDLEKADFDRQSFQYTWLNSYSFSSLQESLSLWYSGTFVILLVVAIRVRSFLQPFEISVTSSRLGYHRLGITVKYCYPYERPPLPRRAVTHLLREIQVPDTRIAIK